MIEHRPRKRFGQHFLHDPAVIGRIVAAIAPARDDRLVEIGPGRGALTAPLLAAVDRLDVVEIDRDLAAALRERYPADRLAVHEGDALEFDFGALAAPGRPLRLVGNLPYNVSTPLLFHVARFASGVRDAHFMLQREVVERMIAGPGGAEYGRLSVMLAARFEMHALFRVAAGAFQPPPKVESAIVRMVPLAAPLVRPAVDAAFAQVVREAFSQRRKTLRNALSKSVSAATLERLGIDPGMRPERLDVAQFARIADMLHEEKGCS